MSPLTVLEAHPAAFIASMFAAGLVAGSFLNVVIHRLPVMLERQWRAQCAELFGAPPAPPAPPYNLWQPRSHCPHCDHLLTARENIPLLSYLMQRGRCLACQHPISPRYFVVELLGGLVAAGAAWQFGFGTAALAAAALGWALIALAGIDLDHQLLPDAITLPFLWVGLGVNLFGTFTDLKAAVIGAMAGYLALWAVYWLFKLATGKEGMGYGDFKLCALLGAWAGWHKLLTVILLASLTGALIGVGLILLRRRSRHAPLPFGPFLAAAGWIALLWGDAIARVYSRWLGLGG